MSTKKHKAMVKKLSAKCSNYIRKEIYVRELELEDVGNRLSKYGLDYTRQNLSGINRRGVFSLGYFLMICKVLGITHIDVDEILGD